MKGYSYAAALLLVCALFSLAPAYAAAPSASRLTLKLETTGEQIAYGSMADAFHELQKQYGAVGFYGTEVLDYSTYGKKKEKLIDADHAYFLVGADNAAGTDGEFKVIAFASREAAKAAQKKTGGELRDFEDAWDAVAEYWGVDMHPAANPPPPATREQQVRRVERAQPEEYCPT